MLEKFGTFLLGMLSTILMYTHPWAAVGASFGCVFFATIPMAARGWKRWALGVFSWGVGYAAGVFVYGGGPPYNEKAMLISGITSALGAIVMTAFVYVVHERGPLPPWAESILDRIPILKGRSGADGS